MRKARILIGMERSNKNPQRAAAAGSRQCYPDMHFGLTCDVNMLGGPCKTPGGGGLSAQRPQSAMPCRAGADGSRQSRRGGWTAGRAHKTPGFLSLTAVAVAFGLQVLLFVSLARLVTGELRCVVLVISRTKGQPLLADCHPNHTVLPSC